MTRVRVREATSADKSIWLEMRCALWPREREEHEATVQAYFTTGTPCLDVVYVAEDDSGGLAGFIELRLRDHAEASDTVGVPYVEGWFVAESRRGSGIGRELMMAAERWAKVLGKSEIASDAELSNAGSISAHAALGFEETGRIVTFIKQLSDGEDDSRSASPDGRGG